MSEELTDEKTEKKALKNEEREVPIPLEERENEETGFVEMDAKMQKKFNRVYGNMKQFERLYTTMAKDLKKALDKIGSLEGKQQEQAISQAVENLKAKKVQALDAADHKAVAEIDDQIAQVRA